MKYPLLVALLGVSSIELHSNIFGKNPGAKLDEEALQKIEDGLAERDNSNLTTQISTLEGTVAGLEATEKTVSESVTAAFALNGLEIDAATPTAEAIATLGAKCKEYGDSNETHSIAKTDGIDKPDEAAEPVYGFEKVLDDTSKYAKLT